MAEDVATRSLPPPEIVQPMGTEGRLSVNMNTLNALHAAAQPWRGARNSERHEHGGKAPMTPPSSPGVAKGIRSDIGFSMHARRFGQGRRQRLCGPAREASPGALAEHQASGVRRSRGGLECPGSKYPLATTFDPAFGDAAEKLRAFAASRGIKTHYISGVRSKDDQQELWDNYQAGLHGQPLPHPERGPVPLAARPGTSLHERGLAADIEADNPADEAALRSFAPQFGLRTKGAADPDHFEFAGMPKSGGVPGTFAYGGGGAAPVAAPATAFVEPPKAPSGPAVDAINHSAPPVGQASAPMSHADHSSATMRLRLASIRDVAVGVAQGRGADLRRWSPSNPNAGSYVDRTGGVPWSFGDFQPEHAQRRGRRARRRPASIRGIRTSGEAADQFALDQMKAVGLGPWKGDKFAANYKGSVLGTSLASTPTRASSTRASIVAHGGTSPPIDASGGTADCCGYRLRPALATLVAKGRRRRGDCAGADQARRRRRTRTGIPSRASRRCRSSLVQWATWPRKATPDARSAAAQPRLRWIRTSVWPLLRSNLVHSRRLRLASARPLSWTSTPYGANAGLIRPGGTTLNATDYGNVLTIKRIPTP